jgi:hypothetical protein
VGEQGERDEAAMVAMVREVKRHAEGLGAIPFSLVVEAATGRRVLAVDEGDEVAEAILDAVAGAAAAVVEEMNRPGSLVRGLRRINEASRFFEDAMGRHLDELEGFRCEVPVTEDGRSMRSGYPDLRLVHELSGRVTYLDPKLYEDGGEGSSLRSFYYQPRTANNKILDDGHHLLVGIRHDGVAGEWTFLGWQVIDLAGFQIQFKAEFQGSNRDLYREEITVRRGG